MTTRMRRESAAAGFMPRIDAASGTPAARQLYLGLREAIMAGGLSQGDRLPSSRTAAREWGVSRGVVAESYELLIAEGYAVARTGSGTYVATGLGLLVTGDATQDTSPPASLQRPISAAVAALLRSPAIQPPPVQVPFVTGRVVHDERTAGLIGRIAQRHMTYARDSYGDPQGEPGLRAAIAAHLTASRGVSCDSSQVFITAGTQQGLDLATRVLVTPGETVLVEDPCYPCARQVFLLNGARVTGIPVDAEGLVTDRLAASEPERPCVLYITPSHQYPAGAVLPLARRLALLAFARETGTWIIEDDYDSEFRYEGRPIASLQGLDRDNRVIYLGTFSKALLPSLRIGYMIVPPDLVPVFRALRPVLDRFPPLMPQLIVADFLNQGYFPAHLRRLRERNRAARDMLLDLVRQRLGEHLVATSPEQGIHLVAGSTGSWSNDLAIAEAAREKGVAVIPVSPMHLATPPQDRLILGFSGLCEEEADDGTRRLLRVFEARTGKG